MVSENSSRATPRASWWWLDKIAIDPEALALIDPDSRIISRAELRSAVWATAKLLYDHGIRRGDRLAIIYGPGTDQAVTLLAAMGIAAVAPIPHVGPAESLEAELQRLHVTWVLVDRAPPTSVSMAAKNLNLPVLCVEPFTLVPAPDGWVLPCPAAGDLALLMQSSGTTSRPKIVPLSHANLLAGASAIVDTLALDRSDRGLAAMPLFHIHGIVAMLLAPLMAGGSVICCRDRSPETLLGQLSQLRPTWLSGSPTLLIALLDERERTGGRLDHCLRLLRSVTMPLTRGLRERLEGAFRVPVLEVYGMTEASSQVCSTRLPGHGIEYRPGNVGTAAGPEVAVLGAKGAHCAAGSIGEVAIRGPSVTSGYEGGGDGGWIADERGERWFLTGDEGYLDQQGCLTLTGRIKEMINRGGLKVNPLRIDEALSQHPAVEEALAFAMPHPTLGEDLMAAVVLRAGATAGEQELRAHLIGSFPAHEVPSGIVFVEALPRGSNGKPIRIGLAERLAECLPTNRTDIESELEHLVDSVFAEVLRLPPAGKDANFFLLGGDSLSSLAAIHRLEHRLGLELNPALLFSFPTVRSLSHQLGQLRASSDADLPKRENIPHAVARPRSDRNAPEAFLASFGQARLWFLHQAAPQLTAYHLPAVWRLRGRLNREALEDALTDLVTRHPTLRTSFRLEADTLLQIIHPEGPFELQEEVLADRDPQQVIEDWIRRENCTPFDLESGRLIRGRLLTVSPMDHILMLNHHHISSDGASRLVLAEDLVVLYNAHWAGSPPKLRPLAVHYHDYAASNRQRLQGRRLEGHVSYWTKQLEGLEALVLPTDRPHSPKAVIEGASLSFEIDSVLVEPFERLCRSVDATLHMGFLAVVALLLHRVSEQDDFAVGIPIWGRNHPDLEPLVGFFVNTLPIRTRFREQQSFRQLLAQVCYTSLEAYNHQELAFDQIVKALKVDRDVNRNPLFQVMLQFVTTPASSLDGMMDLEVERLPLSQNAARFDLECLLRRNQDGGVSGELTYDLGLFDPSTITQLVGRLLVLLQSAVDDPDRPVSRLALLPEAEQTLIVRWQAGCRATSQGRTVDELFARQAASTPAATALVFDGKSLTYAELSGQADNLADRLVRLGAGPDCVVALELERSNDALVAILAIIKAGAAYLPLDPAWPEQRRKDVLMASAATVIITEGVVPSGPKAAALQIVKPSELAVQRLVGPTAVGGRSRPDSLTYVLYTSGSTGQPKGVAMQHSSLVNLLGWQAASSGGALRTLQFASLGFDVSFQEIFTTWTTGGTLFLATDEMRHDPSALLSALERDGIERLFLPVVLLEYLARAAVVAGRFPARLREVCVAGEALRISPAIRQFFEHMPGCSLWNHYGPTETHVVTAYLLSGDPFRWPDLPPIGTPIANTQVYVLDREMQALPIGVAGDIWIGGVAVARGYWRNTSLTDERFVPDTFDRTCDAKLYRTGDRGYWQPDGQLRYLGRKDNQVKIRGHRMELEEIEAVLLSHPDVRVAAVIVSDDHAQVKTLTGFVTCLPGRTPSLHQLRTWLRSRLIEPMIPANIVILPNLPLNANGKVDRKELGAFVKGGGRYREKAVEDTLNADHLADAERRRGLHTLLEKQLIQIWYEMFDSKEITADSNFFDLGGDSLMAVQMSLELERILSHPVPVAKLFAAPTLRLLAGSLVDETWIPAWTSLVALKSTGTRIPLFCIHGFGGGIFHFAEFARALSPDQPVYGVYYKDTEHRKMPLEPLEQLASSYAKEILAFRPAGPYYLAGYSVGGWFAYAVATELKWSGAEVRLFLFDTYPSCHSPWPAAGAQLVTNSLRRIRSNLHHINAIAKLPVWRWPRYIATRATVQRFAARRFPWLCRTKSTTILSGSNSNQPLAEPFVEITSRYSASSIKCDVELFQAPSPSLTLPIRIAQMMFWRLLVRGAVTCHQLSCRHGEIFSSANTPKVAELVETILSRANDIPPQH